MTPGYRIGQAANLTHESLIADGFQPWMVKDFEWDERMEKYIIILNRLEKKFGGDEDWTDKKPEPKPIPVRLDFGEGDIDDIVIKPTND